MTNIIILGGGRVQQFVEECKKNAIDWSDPPPPRKFSENLSKFEISIVP